MIAHIKRGKKVLVVAPSHAACDAVTLSILKLWPKVSPTNGSSELSSSGSGAIVRIGRELRLTVPSLNSLLPQNLPVSGNSKLDRIERDLCLVRKELLEKRRTGAKKGAELEVEKELVKEHRSETLAIEERAIENSKVVIATNSSARSKNILDRIFSGNFDILCVDEAGFATELATLPLIEG